MLFLIITFFHAQTLLAQEAMYQSIKAKMDVLCKCDFIIQAPHLICSDEMGVTFRGSIDRILLTYLDIWVATKATINVLSVALTVDSTCQLQSLDNPLCEAIGARARILSDGLIVGVTIGAALVIVLLIVATIAVMMVKKRHLPKE